MADTVDDRSPLGACKLQSIISPHCKKMTFLANQNTTGEWRPAGHKKAISADSCMAAFALARAIGVMAAVAADVGPGKKMKSSNWNLMFIFKPVQKYCPLFPESRVRVRTGTSLVNLNWTKSALCESF